MMMTAPVIRGAMVTGFDVEVLFLARKLGYAIREVPVRWNYDVPDSKVSALKDSWRNFRDVLKVRINDLLEGDTHGEPMRTPGAAVQPVQGLKPDIRWYK